MKNYYQTLGVSPSATREEIEGAFKRLWANRPAGMEWLGNFFEELLDNVKEAYQVLSDEEKRNEYNSRYQHFFFGK